MAPRPRTSPARDAPDPVADVHASVQIEETRETVIADGSWVHAAVLEEPSEELHPPAPARGSDRRPPGFRPPPASRPVPRERVAWHDPYPTTQDLDEQASLAGHPFETLTQELDPEVASAAVYPAGSYRRLFGATAEDAPSAVDDPTNMFEPSEWEDSRAQAWEEPSAEWAPPAAAVESVDPYRSTGGATGGFAPAPMSPRARVPSPSLHSDPRSEPFAPTEWPPAPLRPGTGAPVGWTGEQTSFIAAPWTAAERDPPAQNFSPEPPPARGFLGIDSTTWALGLAALFITGLVTGGAAAVVVFALSLQK